MIKHRRFIYAILALLILIAMISSCSSSNDLVSKSALRGYENNFVTRINTQFSGSLIPFSFLVAEWNFDDCSGSDSSGNGYDLVASGDFAERCIDGVIGNGATVVSQAPTFTCVHVPVIPEIGNSSKLIFSFFFRFRNYQLFHPHGTALFSFGQGTTVGYPFFGVFFYPISTSEGPAVNMALRYENRAYGRGSNGGEFDSWSQWTTISDTDYHSVVILVDTSANTATISIDDSYLDEIPIDSDFAYLGTTPGFLGAHEWWYGSTSCYGRATVDLDEFRISKLW